jgi:hypothetical protein
MTELNATKCPICGDTIVPVEAALNRAWWNVISAGFGSSELQIRLPGHPWMAFMRPERAARANYCTSCGSLTIAPSLPEHRRALGIDEP